MPRFLCLRTALCTSLLLLISLLPAAVSETPPAVFGTSGENLRAWRDFAQTGGHHPALVELKREADRALKEPPESVMDKTLTADSGDKHDYFSLAPYWWPDPKKPDGKPFIRRDGEVHPDSRKGNDAPAFGRLSDRVETLALAYFLTGHEPYAEHAARLVRVWFLDPATRMNPNLEHAQAIPGRNNGRGAGVLQGRRLGVVADSMTLLAQSPAWKTEDTAAFRGWLENYYRWLTTSPNARDEENAENNHGTWFDVQAVHLALVLGKSDEAKARLVAARDRRLAKQIEPDGRQPRELARTKSLDYSLFNLEALFSLARLADRAGVEWWSYETPDHRSLHAALAYVAPYVDPTKEWPKKDLVAGDRERILPLLAEFLGHREVPALRNLFAQFSASPEAKRARWQILEGQAPAPVPATPGR